ncbi:MAG: XdhC family protein [Oscillospiraceae bacterium]|nr:XdhC family protein [Oscillospiraceae bacterium]
MISVYAKAAELCREGVPFVYAAVISQDGSTPRGTGSKMLITADGIFDTVGGGGMEGSVISAAREKVLSDGMPLILSYDMSSEEAASADFICGGRCEILLFRGEKEYLEVFEEADAACSGGVPAWLFYIIDEAGAVGRPFCLCLNVDCRRLVGEYEGLGAFPRDILLSPLRTAVHGDHVDGVRYITDSVGSAPMMYIFGGGHVSKEVAKIAVGTGFSVTIIDDREEFANTARFPDCRCEVVDFNNMPDFPVDKTSYVVIMTRGHSFDREVLKWALGKELKYLGMIGSRSKRDSTYRLLQSQGYSMEKMLSVKCPIGLSIGAETPAEIAVSIMAEVIQVRRSR